MITMVEELELGPNCPLRPSICSLTVQARLFDERQEKKHKSKNIVMLLS